MPGVVFLIVIPTANFEREIFYGQDWNNKEILSSGILNQPQKLPPSTNDGNTSIVNSSNNLNINLPENNNAAIVRLEVELRDKNLGKNRRGRGIGGKNPGIGGGGGVGRVNDNDNNNALIPMEKILEELLTKLEIDHVTWTCDKKGYYHHIIFPIPAGEPCETTLHCLTELGIGTKLNSSVSVLPCSVSYDAISDAVKDIESEDDEELSKWNNFVESIKSKLTVKQVVDGVRAGGSLSFDYILLIVTADSLAALGLVENNAPNITAAMLVSPLMGPVMSITFGTIISDRELVKVGFLALSLGMFISLLFGFIFGLILGTTEMPWGFNDWPTDEMRARGNARSLWMGILWALTSGTGVAVALLQGSAGPLIGVAISASLLPPVVNCGLFWALACIWLIYPGIKVPHLKGESYTGNSTYPFLYTNYLPTEFLINGIVSGLLTVINVICIFITAIIVLKIKEVSAPYTASPDLKRFWETDLRTARKTNRSTMRQRKTLKERNLPYDELKEPRNRELEKVLEQAIEEASDDVTLQKVKRMSYSSNAAGELLRPSHQHGLNSNVVTQGNSALNSVRNSKITTDLQVLDKLLSTLLEQQKHNNDCSDSYTNTGFSRNSRRGSTKLSRWGPLSRSISNLVGSRTGSMKTKGDAVLNSMGMTTSCSNSNNMGHTGTIQHTSLMPTILEQNQSKNNSVSLNSHENSVNMNSIRNVLDSIANVPHRFSQRNSTKNDDDENINLPQNIIE